MPGPQIKDWGLYHKLRKKRYSKASAARIANSKGKRRKRKGKRRGTKKR
jgi:hypothetical protein